MNIRNRCQSVARSVQYLQGLIVGQVGLDDADVGAITQLLGDALVSGGFVADDANDGVFRVGRQLAEKLPLSQVNAG
jgi:hypothetical protein